MLEYVRKHELIGAGDRVGVAVSGGLDSVALLRLLLDLRGEVGIVLSVVHLNHGLRGVESDEDERFVSDLAKTHGLEFHSQRTNVKAYAAERHLSLETAGREVRYQFFGEVLFEQALKAVATAHTLDDQAETVLLRIVRGAGNRGLAGIYPNLPVNNQSNDISPGEKDAAPQPGSKAIIRPLLGTRRRDLEQYLAGLSQSWREDQSNRDLRHARNRVRHGILPRLERNLNPAVREALAETAEIARDEEIYWDRELSQLLPNFWRRYSRDEKDGIETSGELKRQLPELPAIQRRIVRAAAESLGLSLEFRHVEEILRLAVGGATTANLPGGWTVVRDQKYLRFVPPSEEDEVASDYERLLPVPGCAEVPEAGLRLEANLLDPAPAATYDPDCLLSRGSIVSGLLVRNWRPGDRFWPSHTKEPKKIKELLADKHITGAARKLWPVLVSGENVVWVRGFRTPAELQPRPNEYAVLIREIPLPIRRTTEFDDGRVK